ncbi:MAG: hypothetical protein Q9169_005075 [Polycauliona sp. 2 TL-2023]
MASTTAKSDRSLVHCNHLVTYSNYSGVSRSASILEEPDPVSYNLLTFLAAAQWREIDFLHITWQPALDIAGKGATAEIQQSLVSLAFTFAFKRFLSPSAVNETSRHYRAIISELCILGHPTVKQHPNIVKLQGICWDVISEDQAWPVLVFPKAKYGNLREFLASDEGARLTPDQCMALIAGCVQAVVFMHTLGIVHGDIKPENILVVEDQVHGYRAELCDFGFSTINVKDSMIQLPSSWPWTSPEYHRRGFSLDHAKKADIFSLGLVTLWILYRYSYRARKEFQTVPNSGGEGCDNILSDANPAGYQWIENLQTSGATRQSIDNCLSGLVDLGEDNMSELHAFLSGVLDRDPETRTMCITFLQPPSVPDRVRTIIARRLEECAMFSGPTTLREQAGIQFATCLAIGFGIERDVPRSASLADQCGVSYKAVMADLAPLQNRASWDYYNPKIQQMAATGLLRDMDYVHEYRELLTAEAVEKNSRRELIDMKAVFRTTHPIIYSLNMQLVHSLKSVGKMNDAQELLNQFMIDCRDNSETPIHGLNILAAREAQASLARHQGDYILAKRIATPLLEDAKASLGTLHLSTCPFRNSLALIHMAAGDYDQARDLLREAMEITTAEYGPDHPETLAIAGNLAKVLERQGELEAAEDAATEVYTSSTKMFGVVHPMTLASASNLASIQQSRGKLALAQTLLEKSVEVYENQNGASNPSTLRTLSSLAVLRRKRGHLDAAEKDLIRVIHGQEALYGRAHVETQSSVNNLAGVLMQRHNFGAAKVLYKEVLDNTRQSLGEEHFETVTSTNNLALACQLQRDYNEAEALYEWAYDRTMKHFGEQHPRALKILSNIAGVLYSQGKLGEAESLYRQVLRHRRRAIDSDHPDIFETMSNLAAVLMEQGKLEESEAMNRDALNAKLQQFERDHPSVLTTVNNMSTLLLVRGDYDGAEEMALWAVEGRRTAFGPDHPETLSSMAILEQIRRARDNGVDVPSLLKI